MGGYPGSNRELTVPHTVALPIELYPPYITFNTCIPARGTSAFSPLTKPGRPKWFAILLLLLRT